MPRTRAFLRIGLFAVICSCRSSAPPEGAQPAEPAAAEPKTEAEPPPAAEAKPAEAEAKPDEPTAPPAAPPASSNAALLDPGRGTDTAPERFTALLKTTKGDLHVDVRRSWAPLGADRFYNLVKLGFYDNVAFFRVIEGFMAQTGLHGDPAVNAAWRPRAIADDPVAQSNLPGTIAFAMSGRNSRTTQVFINLVPNGQLDSMGFAPFGRVRELEVAQQLFSGYGEGAPQGQGPMQARIQREGNAYLKAEFPKLDYIVHASIVEETRAPVKQRALPIK